MTTAAAQHRADVAKLSPGLASAIRQRLTVQQKKAVGAMRAWTGLNGRAETAGLRTAVLPAITAAVGTGSARVATAAGTTAPTPDATLAGALAWKFATQFTATTLDQLAALPSLPSADDLDTLFSVRLAAAAAAAAWMVSESINAGAQHYATSLPTGSVPDKTWIVTGAHPCPTCAEVDGETVPGNHDFRNGAPHGALHSGCQCTVAWTASDQSRSTRSDPMAEKYKQADRDEMAKSGVAMPDGSYPVKDKEDLQNAIHAVGRGNATHDKIRKHIIARAKALGLTSTIPDNWNADGSLKTADSADPAGETRTTPALANDPTKPYEPQPYHADPDEKVICPKCKKHNDTDARFCDQCGDKLVGSTGVDVLRARRALRAPRKHAPALKGIETRAFTLSDVQVRAGADDSTAHFVGYASTTGEPYPVTDFLGEYRETIKPGAFAKTLREMPTAVPLLFNHDGMPVASTGSGTMRLSEDSRGLKVEADLDRRQGLTNDLCIALERGDLSQMSFSFSAIKQDWNDDYTERSVTELRLYDASIVTYPANPTTTAALRSGLAAAVGQPEHARIRTVAADVRRSHADFSAALAELREGRVLSAANVEQLNAALAALHRADDALTGVDSALDEGQEAISGVLQVANPDGDKTDPDDNGQPGFQQDGATGGSSPKIGNPIMPADGAGPRSAPPASVVQTRALVEELRSPRR